MKYKLLFLFAVVGGIVGLIVHLIWHFRVGIGLFSFGSHIIWGVVYTVAGMIISVFLWYLLNRKSFK